MSATPDLRLHLRNDAPERPGGRYVLYWMRAARRTAWNYGLDRAVERAKAFGVPLLVFEDLRVGDPWASDRRHRFVLDGMADTARRLRARGVRYYPYVEPARGAGDGLVEALAAEACLVVTDESPMRPDRRLAARLAGRVPCRFEEVDSCGLLPLLLAADRVFATAFAFRRFLQNHLPEHLAEPPRADPLLRAHLRPLGSRPQGIARRWPPASAALLTGEAKALAPLPIDHAVPPAPIRGGPTAGRAALRRFLDRHLAHYAERRNHPDDDATSGLAPYLHFGHLSPHEVLAAIAAREGWSPERLAAKATGGREGWWGMGPGAEAFLDQLVTWRELGYNFASRRDDCDAYASLPPWARRTLAEHARDRRPYRYGRARLAAARTHDRLWNAAQGQLVREGRLHNYLRMLWGKKILEWSRSPEAALGVMIDLNNRYALDGCDPNSYSGILWILGRYDRPWGPRRAVFGTVRYMSSENTRRKVRVREYLERYAPGA